MRSTLLLSTLLPLAFAQEPSTTSTTTITSWWTATSTQTVIRASKAVATSSPLTEVVAANSTASAAVTEAVASSSSVLTEAVAASSSVLTEAIAAGNASGTTLTELIASTAGAAGNANANVNTLTINAQATSAPFQMPNATSGLVFGVKGTGTGATPAAFTGAAARVAGTSEFGGLAAMVVGALGMMFL
ncbi:MAG: hypothetical protein M1820_001291 [Bogoriella megaspora]|nr:MAG: hypothetical protein M1820_001291 [Bogoriella megaspora]